MKKLLFIIPIIISVFIAGATIFQLKTNIPPGSDLDIARKKILEAELVSSSRYSKEHFLKATELYDSAMIEWKKENERFILLRNYREIEKLAEKSVENSISAITGAKLNIVKVKESLETRINGLKEKIKEFDNRYNKFPMNSDHRREITKGKLQYSEALLAFQNKDYATSKVKLDSSEKVIDKLLLFYQERYDSYLSQHADWAEMVKKTISTSKKNMEYCIIIDKMSRECTLYKNGEIYKIFTVELGLNWIGDKNQQGDKSTPEGMYKVINKKSNGQSVFYKALLLNYPNEDDKKRFLQNKKKGIVKPDAEIGNLIEIHGHGGKGVDWTNGCIALKDSDMDILFKLCKLDTKVTIVGTTKSIKELQLSQK